MQAVGPWGNQALKSLLFRLDQIGDQIRDRSIQILLDRLWRGEMTAEAGAKAVAVLKQAIQTTGARGLFYDVRDLLRVIRSTYDASIRTTELEVLRPVMQADLLVLDDLGAEKTSEWVEETMNLIVNTRYNEKRLTIFTTNYLDIPDVEEPNSLLSRIGHRMRSRLHEMAEFLVLDAADYRELPANGGPDDLMTMWKMRKKTLPSPRTGRQARAQLRDGKGDLKWSGGRGGS